MTDQANEEKIWEKPWSYSDMKTNSTDWTLAGDAGLLLHLKQFSENLISKSVEIEKKLQKLNHTEQQCLAKLNNATSSFLLLENTQFIENRVYEHELADSKPKEVETKKEKTKEEKEIELFAKMNEAVLVGMSIMDTYFEKLDPKQTKDSDDEDDEDEKTSKDASELFIYETKDPYVLRSLPYLIGSQAFLDNDHVGLKDLDSDDEDEVEDEDEEVDKTEKKVDELSETESKYSEHKSHKQDKIRDNDSDSSESSDDDDLFKTKEDKKGNLFDDSDNSSSEEEEQQVKEEKPSKSKQEDLFDDEDDDQDDKEDEPVQKQQVAPPMLDFAAELSARFANKGNKNKPPTATGEQEKKENEQPPSKPVVKLPAKSNLFDSDEDEEDNEMFKPVNKKPAKNLFDDDDDEEDEDNFMTTKTKPNKPVPPEPEPEPEQISEPKSKAMPKSELTSALNDLFAKKAKPKSSFLSDDDEDDPLFSSNKPSEVKQQEVVQLPPPTSQATKKKISIFDDEDEEEETIKKVEPPKPVVTKPTKSIFDDDDEEEESDLFAKLPPSKVTPTKPSTNQAPVSTNVSTTQSKKQVSLFDSTDSSPESNLDEPKSKQPISNTSTASKPIKKTNNLFETSEESSSPDLFTSTKLNNKLAETSDLFSDEINDSMPELKKPNEPKVASKTETTNKPPAKKSLFDSSTEDESDDLFKITSKPTKPIESVKQQEVKKPPPTKSLFDSKSEEDEDDLFKTIKVAKEEPVLKDPLFKEPELPPARKTTNEDLPKSEDSVKSAKPTGGKNILFNPDALKNSGLFKKLAVQSKDSDSDQSDTEINKPTPPAQAPLVSSMPEPIKIVSQTSIKPAVVTENVDDFFSTTTTKPIIKSIDEPKKSQIVSTSNQNEDLFSEIKVDKAFSDTTMKNAQKDRIKAAAGKKRPPGNRKPTVEKLNNDSEEPSTEPVKKETPTIVREEIKQPASIFDDDDDIFTTKVTEVKVEPIKPIEPVVEETKAPSLIGLNLEKKSTTSRKSLENIFDDNDDDDIFKAKPIKSNKQSEIKSEPEKISTSPIKTSTVPTTTTTTAAATSASIFDSGSDEFDLFASTTVSSTKNKKKPESKKKTLDNIFDDDTDIFSDVSTLTTKKKPDETTPKKKTETIAATTKPAVKTNTNKRDLFANLSDDDDIFSSSSKPRSSSGSKPTTTKKEDETKKKDDIFDDPLNTF